jgi:26S proteasome regulatory subunit N9
LADPQAAISFLETIASKVEANKDAYVLAVMEAAHFKLALHNLEATKVAMEECETILDTLAGVDPVIHASFYRVSADYNKVRSRIAPFAV